MEKSSFFNSINGDRKYKSEEFAAYFGSFIGNGIFPNPSTNLQVISNNDMTVTIKKGKAWINGYFYDNTDDLILVIDNADGVLNRIDRVVVRLNKVTRDIKTIIKKGAFASNPVAPEITRSADIHELGIAEIKINKGTVSIVQSNIVDTRLNLNVCGVTNSLITVDVEMITNQFSQDFESWFDMIKDQLGEDPAGNLQNQIGNINDPTLPLVLKGKTLTEQTKFLAAEGGKVKSVNAKTGEVVIDIEDIKGLNSKSTIIGLGADGDNQIGCISIGENASAVGFNGIALGYQAQAGTTGSNGSTAIAIGVQSKALENYAIAIGRQSKATSNSVAIGQGANSSDGYGVALGTGTTCKGFYSVAIGRNAANLNGGEGFLGDDQWTKAWKVPGSFHVSGTKNFEMPHPKPSKKSTHVIRHGAVESPTAGDTLYRYKVKSTKENDIQIIELPDYFIHLNKDVQIFVTPQGHFGNGYGNLNRNTEQLEINCELPGEYNVLVIGTRNDDHQSVQNWDIRGVEREIGESWDGETYVFEVDEITEIEEITRQNEEEI